MTHSEPRLLQVYLHGQPAGIITEVAPHRTVFAFDPAYRSGFWQLNLSEAGVAQQVA